MAIWLCKCGIDHTRKERKCKKCGVKKKDTVFLGFTALSSQGMIVMTSPLPYSGETQWATTYRKNRQAK